MNNEGEKAARAWIHENYREVGESLDRVMDTVTRAGGEIEVRLPLLSSSRFWRLEEWLQGFVERKQMIRSTDHSRDMWFDSVRHGYVRVTSRNGRRDVFIKKERLRRVYIGEYTRVALSREIEIEDTESGYLAYCAKRHAEKDARRLVLRDKERTSFVVDGRGVRIDLTAVRDEKDDESFEAEVEVTTPFVWQGLKNALHMAVAMERHVFGTRR